MLPNQHGNCPDNPGPRRAVRARRGSNPEGQFAGQLTAPFMSPPPCSLSQGPTASQQGFPPAQPTMDSPVFPSLQAQAQHEAHLNDARQQNEILRLDNARLAAEVQRLVAERLACQTAVERNAVLEHENAVLRHELEAAARGAPLFGAALEENQRLTGENRALKTEMEALRAVVAPVQAAQAILEEKRCLAEENETLKTRVRRLEGRLFSHERVVEDRERIKREMKGLREQLKLLQADERYARWAKLEIGYLERAVRRAQNDIKTMCEEHKVACQALQKENARLQAESITLRSPLERSRHLPEDEARGHGSQSLKRKGRPSATAEQPVAESPKPELDLGPLNGASDERPPKQDTEIKPKRPRLHEPVDEVDSETLRQKSYTEGVDFLFDEIPKLAASFPGSSAASSNQDPAAALDKLQTAYDLAKAYKSANAPSVLVYDILVTALNIYWSHNWKDQPQVLRNVYLFLLRLNVAGVPEIMDVLKGEKS